MRIVYTSDLHADFGPQNAALLGPLAAHAARLRPDVLLLAGDLAETLAGVRTSLERFATVAARKLYLPGNHDLFVDDETALAAGGTSRDKFERGLPAAAAAAGFEFVGAGPLRCGEFAIVGVPGWYDFSLRDPALDTSVHLDHYRAGMWRGQRAFDRGQVFWDGERAAPPPGSQPARVPGRWAGDEEICDFMFARLEEQLRVAGDAPGLIAAVHVLPFPELVQRQAFAPCAFHDAYLGSARFGARLRREPRLRAVITGHLHRPADLQLDGVRIVASPIGNLRAPDLDLEAVAVERLGCLDLD